MTWLFILLAMAVIALAAGVVTGRIAGSMGPPATSLPFRGLPLDDDVVPADLDTLRFDAALRGYRMDEVDAVIDRLALELTRRDDEIARLRAALAGPPGDADLEDAAPAGQADPAAQADPVASVVPGAPVPSEQGGPVRPDGGDEVPAGVEGRAGSAPDQD